MAGIRYRVPCFSHGQLKVHILPVWPEKGGRRDSEWVERVIDRKQDRKRGRYFCNYKRIQDND